MMPLSAPRAEARWRRLPAWSPRPELGGGRRRTGMHG